MEGINSIHARKSNNSKPISFIKDPDDDNSISSNPNRTANILNEHFASVGPKLANKLPSVQSNYFYVLNRYNSPDTSFASNLVTPTQVKLEISRTPNNKSHGLYSCPNQILKCASNVISNTLAEIINLSISTGVYPNKFKMAKIVPIFKIDDNTDPSNYGLISLLSTRFNRIFEKLIFKRMESFIEQNNQFSPSQYGFRKTLSTQHAILDTVSTIQTNMDKHLFSCGVFIDLKKAFDTVNHNILLHKLDH